MLTALQLLARSWLTLCYVALASVWAIALKYRADLVDTRFGDLVDCVGCFKSTVVNADSPVLIGASALLLLSLTFRHWVLALTCRLLLLLLTALYVLDIYVYESFNSRLHTSDIGRYFDVEVLGKYLQDNLIHLPYGWELAALAVVTIVCFMSFQLKGKLGKAVQCAAGIMLVVSSTGLLLKPQSYVHNAMIDNVFAVNSEGAESQAFSEGLRGELERPTANNSSLTCSKTSGTKPNIILLIVESWSSWQSQYFSGLNNWTPRLDEIARSHQANTNFLANGFTTNEGLVAMLTGRPPLPAVAAFNALTPFQNFWNLDRTLPAMLRAQGYQSLFLTSGDLGFSSKGRWLKNLGFDYIEGHDHPGYRGLTRFGFNSVADAAQYSRALELLTGDSQLQRFRSHWPGPLPITAVEEANGKHYENLPYDIDLLGSLAADAKSIAAGSARLQIQGKTLVTIALDNDPALYFRSLKLAHARDYQLEVTLSAPGPTTAQLFYKAGSDALFTEAESVTHNLSAGENNFTWSFSIDRAPGEIRLDPGALPGDYRITQLRLRSQSYADPTQNRVDTPLTPDKPYFMAIETVSTHHPYLNPMTMVRSAQQTFEYADATAGLFYDALRDSDFFDNGVLIITSDHRSMTPMAKSELDRFGLSAKTRIPLIVVAPSLATHSYTQGRFQQSDLPASLLQLSPGENCQLTDLGNLFTQPARHPTCVLHHRGDRRDYVDAFCGENEGTIQLKGDDTRVISGDLKNVNKLINAINRQRIQGSKNNRS